MFPGEKRQLTLKKVNRNKKLKNEPDTSISQEEPTSFNKKVGEPSQSTENVITNEECKYTGKADEVFFSQERDLDNNSDNSESSCSEGEEENITSSDDDDDVDLKTKRMRHDKSKHMCPQIREKLRVWAIKFTVVQVIITALLCLLQDVFPCLPSHAHNLLKTDNKFIIESLFPENKADKSEFVYVGLAHQLKRTVNPKNHLDKTLLLQFNIDGLPLFKSGGIEFWPILGRINFCSNLYEPFVIAAFSGVGKPALLNRFFTKFITELNELLNNGVVIDGDVFSVRVMCFVCDRPARSFVKNIVNHNAFYSCERCNQKEVSVEKRMVFPEVDSQLRTDASFRAMDQPEHHSGLSPLTKIFPAINMIFHFPLDFMHLCCLGVMKKLIECWLTNIVGTRLSRENIMRLTQRITNLNSQIPVEFQRTILQSLGLISKWKATEFRFFLLYCGPFVMKDLLSDELYNNFILLHCAMRILCSNQLCLILSAHAQDYLKRFVLFCGKFYKVQSLVSNVHALLHITDDVNFHRCSLSDLTAFPFENALGKLKKMVHSGQKPLQQLCKRLSEKYSIDTEKAVKPPIFKVLKIKKAACKADNKISSFKYNDFTYTISQPNNCVLLNSGDFVMIQKISGTNEQDIIIHGNKLNILDDVFKEPTKSSTLNIHTISIGKEKSEFNLSEINAKSVLLTIYELEDDEKKMYVLPMLH